METLNEKEVDSFKMSTFTNELNYFTTMMELKVNMEDEVSSSESESEPDYDSDTLSTITEESSGYSPVAVLVRVYANGCPLNLTL